MNHSTQEANELIRDGVIALSRVEENGIRIDVDYLKRITGKVSEKIDQLDAEFRRSKIYKRWAKTYGSKTSMTNTNQLADVLYNQMGYKGERSDGGKLWKKDQEAFETIDDPAMKKFILAGKLRKLKGTFLKGIRNETIDGYLHPVFNLHTTITHRGSSEALNFQNLPIRDPMQGKIIRRCFIPRKNHVLVEIDYAGIEVRVAACYNHDPRMIEYILDPTKDMHRDMAAECFKCAPQQAAENKGLRQSAKGNFVFAQFYGSWFKQCAPKLWSDIAEYDLKIGDQSLYDWLKQKGIRKLGDCAADADVERNSYVEHIQKVEHDFWKKRFRVYDEWRREWFSEYQKVGGFMTLTGFWLSGVMSRKDTINYPIQGSAFHCLLWSLTQLVRTLSKEKWKTKIVGQIHDSIVADVHIDEFDEYLALAKEIMTERVRKHWKWIIVPLEIEAKVCGLGETWYDQKELAI